MKKHFLKWWLEPRKVPKNLNQIKGIEWLCYQAFKAGINYQKTKG